MGEIIMKKLTSVIAVIFMVLVLFLAMHEGIVYISISDLQKNLVPIAKWVSAVLGSVLLTRYLKDSPGS